MKSKVLRATYILWAGVVSIILFSIGISTERARDHIIVHYIMAMILASLFSANEDFVLTGKLKRSGWVYFLFFGITLLLLGATPFYCGWIFYTVKEGTLFEACILSGIEFALSLGILIRGRRKLNA